MIIDILTILEAVLFLKNNGESEEEKLEFFSLEPDIIASYLEDKGYTITGEDVHARLYAYGKKTKKISPDGLVEYFLFIRSGEGKCVFSLGVLLNEIAERKGIQFTTNIQRVFWFFATIAAISTIIVNFINLYIISNKIAI